MSGSEKRVIIVTAEQIARIAKGETIEIVPAKRDHKIELNVDDGNLLTAKYVPSE